MSIYVNLKFFREEHGLFQDKVAKALGINQSTYSRMENMHKELEDWQYKKLVDEFGEEAVKPFVGQSPVQNALGGSLRRRHYYPTQSEPSDVVTLTEVIRKQQEEITKLNARIAELTDLLLKK